MERLVADLKSTLDLVLMSVSLLLKHYDDSEQQLQEIDGKLTAVGMKKESLPGHYKMAMDYHEMLVTSTPSERVNSAVDRKFTYT
ncbi:unnamed protein product [Sphagnum tenellum]